MWLRSVITQESGEKHINRTNNLQGRFKSAWWDQNHSRIQFLEASYFVFSTVVYTNHHAKGFGRQAADK